MKRNILIICSLLFILVQCASPTLDDTSHGRQEIQLPRVLIITTGISGENPQLAQGITLAIQSFNKMGATVRLETRDILHNYQELKDYSILIISTFPGYHDADRKYSLSFMSDEELHNLVMFVRNGGVLISGENVGRNYNDGTDRIVIFPQLNHDNWELADCYGVTLSEKNLTGYDLVGRIPEYLNWDISHSDLAGEDRELWTLNPDSFLSDNYKVLGYWKKEKDSLIAIVEHKFGSGKSVLLASSGLLHPKNDGGFWSEEQIGKFYAYIIDSYNHDNGISVRLNPWPEAHDYAFCVSLNAAGQPEEYKRVFRMLKENNIQPVIFVNGKVEKEIKSMLRDGKYLLASSGYGYINHSRLRYPQAVEDILLNEDAWDIQFTGFRFPFTNPAFWSLLALAEHDYLYESSIGADNLDFFHGSTVPYNLVISIEGYYRSTDILEIAPTYHDDYYFLDMIKGNNAPDSNQLGKNIMIYSKYLLNFWDYSVKPYNGLMVFLGHPKYVGYNDSTLTALANLIRHVKDDNAWLTDMDEVARFRKNVGMMKLFVDSGNKKQKIEISAPEGVYVGNLCLVLKGKLRKASAKSGKVTIINDQGDPRLVFDAFNGQVITIETE